MNYPSYFKKTSQTHAQNIKAQENKANTINIKKLNDQDQESYALKGGDSFQMKDLKNKMKIVMQKLSTMRKQKQQLHKENQSLQKQIITLRNNVRHMIPGFNNTSSKFPMINEIIAKLLEFYKYECLDRFFENLCPQELSMKGVIYFYHFSFTEIIKIIDGHFQQTFELIKTTGCLQKLDGPIMNVLRKSYQGTFDEIIKKIISKGKVPNIAASLIDKLSLSSQQRQPLLQTMRQFLQKMLQLCIYSKISDPPLIIETESIGKKIRFNSIFNDPLDGFIKNKEQCWVVLPQIRRSENQQLIVKSLVLKTDYFEQQEEEQGQGDQK